jgi:ATP-dependent Clp protease ATP-binding subunit ClpB
MNVMRQAFRPEFLNRLDETVLFHRLTRRNMTGIVAIQLKRLQALLADRKLELQLDERAREWLAEAGYDPVYGARPLKRVIQRELQNPLASLLLEGRFKPADTIRVSAEKEGLTIDGKKLSEAA